VLNRLLSRTPDPSFTGAPAETFTYTLTGKRASMTDASGGTTYTYTNRDQVLSKATPQGALSYTYDLSGNVASEVSSNANGTNVSYTWDAANQLATVMDHWTNGQTNYAFDQTAQLKSVAYPNGVTHNYATYDNRDRLTNLNVTGPGGAIASHVQAFSFSGRKTSAAEAGGRTASYGYDTIYRLLSENITGDPISANNGSLGYSLDSVGNRSALATSLAALTSQSFTYDANDRISGDTFDANGNTLTSGGHTFSYDFQDRLTQNDNTVGMLYDGDGNRVARTEGGVTHRYLIDDQTPTGYPQIAEELVPTDGVIRQYTYGAMRISQRRLIVSPNWELSYYGYDGGGSVRQLFNPSGVVTDTYSYDAFGNTVARTGTTLNEFLYRGEQFDSTLGMYNLRARYYRPQVGRFLTADKYEGAEVAACDCANRGMRVPPIGTHHLFSYGAADPVDYIDPTGNENTFFRTLLLRTQFFAIRAIPLVGRFPRCTFALLKDVLFAFTLANPQPFVEEIAIPAYVACLQGGPLF
jgi:RHS repeat-associated protein